MQLLRLAPLLAASAAGLRGLSPPAAAESSAAQWTKHETCRAFPGKQVVLVTVNKDFFPFFKNWLHYAGPYLTSTEQVVAFTEDEESVPLLRDFLREGAGTPFKIAVPTNATTWELQLASDRPSSLDLALIGIQDEKPFESRGYKKLVSQRPREIRHFLDQNCSVLYADIDTAWLQNPFDSIKRAGDYEMYVTDDEDKTPYASLNSTYLCSCFLYMHPTSNVKAVVSRWEHLMRRPAHNQPRFNKAFHQIRKLSPGFAVLLPRSEFPPGKIHSDSPMVLHANGIAGEQKKMSFLKERGAWSLN